jgi:hypothetical protein
MFLQRLEFSTKNGFCSTFELDDCPILLATLGHAGASTHFGSSINFALVLLPGWKSRIIYQLSHRLGNPAQVVRATSSLKGSNFTHFHDEPMMFFKNFYDSFKRTEGVNKIKW